MTAAKHIAAALAAAACTAAGAQQLSCSNSAILNEVKMIFAENVIMVAEQQMAIRHSLDRQTTRSEIAADRERMTSKLQITNIIDTGPQGGGFPVWCSAEIALKTTPQHSMRVEYRSRESADHPGGVHTQAKASLPPGPAGFNLLIGLRGALVK